ncbi:hypothetical protein ASZ90_001619 [hydrocarbon metagenome]|uniref:Uncharacterized protein n=1 Tax=hydrocarbon metagenome TaxID=938273 RepID=A0A0W8G5T2_9ZZZZ
MFHAVSIVWTGLAHPRTKIEPRQRPVPCLLPAPDIVSL